MSSISETSVQISTEFNGDVKHGKSSSSGNIHVLYSRGRMFKNADDANYFELLQKIALLTRRSPQEVEEIILTGKRKKIKSSATLKTLIQLEAKLKELSLDVYIEPESDKIK